MAMTDEHKAKLKTARENAKKKRDEQNSNEGAAVPQKKKLRTQFGMRMKLGVINKIPGYRMIFVNDYNGELESYLHMGWQYVKPEEVDMTSVSFRDTDKDLGNRISRETSVGNERIRTYLLKISEELAEELDNELEAMAEARERPIKAGTHGMYDHEYTNGQTRITSN